MSREIKLDMPDRRVEKVIEAAVLLPGDTLVVNLPGDTDLRELDEFSSRLSARVGDGIRVAAIAGAVSMYVLRSGCETEVES